MHLRAKQPRLSTKVWQKSQCKDMRKLGAFKRLKSREDLLFLAYFRAIKEVQIFLLGV